eukprot:g41276.t1
MVQKHNLIDSQISSHGKNLKHINKKADNLGRSSELNTDLVQGKLKELNDAYSNLLELSKVRRSKLKQQQQLFEFFRDCDEEESWIFEKWQTVRTAVLGRDVTQIAALIQKHKVPTGITTALESEVNSRQSICFSVVRKGQHLYQRSLDCEKEVRRWVSTLQKQWQQLKDEIANRSSRLQAALTIKQYFADVNEARSWLLEKQPLLESEDCGKDESSADTLLQRHMRLEKEIAAYSGEVKRLGDLAAVAVQQAENQESKETESCSSDEEAVGLQTPLREHHQAGADKNRLKVKLPESQTARERRQPLGARGKISITISEPS